MKSDSPIEPEGPPLDQFFGVSRRSGLALRKGARVIKRKRLRRRAKKKKSDCSIEPEGLPLDQYFTFVGVGKTKGYQLIKAGVLPTRKIGRKRIGLRGEGLKFLESLPTK
jgi:hypothetical protein